MFSEKRKNTGQNTILIFVILVIHHPSALWGQELLSDSAGKHMQKPLRFAFVVGCQMCFGFFTYLFNYWPLLGVSSDSECFHGTSYDEVVPREVLQSRSGTTNVTRQVTQGKFSCFK